MARAGDHPLRMPENAAAKLVSAGLTAEQAVAAVVTFTKVEIDEDGTTQTTSGAELPLVEGESVGETTDVAECMSDELPLMDAEVERILQDLGAPRIVGVSLLVGARSRPRTFGVAWASANLESVGGDAPNAGELRGQVADARREALGADLQLVVNFVEAAGGDIVEVAELSGTVEVQVDAAQLAEILTLPEVVAAQVPTTSTDDFYSWTTPGWSTGDELSGEEIEEIIQSRIFYRHADGPFLGAGTGIGMVEPQGGELYLFHEGWEDGYGVSRVANCDWSYGSCLPYVPSIGGQHSTAVASVIVGDLTLGQDPGILTMSAQRKRSGVARGATLVGMNSGSRAAVEAWATTAFQGSIINHSANPPPNCTGNTDWARTVNAIYESGIGWFNAMGNNHHDDPSACTAGGAASALGAFAVSAIRWNDGSTTNGMYEDNARGGTGGAAGDGRSRAIVGLAAPTLFEFPYVHMGLLYDCAGQPMTYGTDWGHTAACGPEGIGATSGATPVVTGAAAIFKEYFLDAFNTYIEDPGALYTNLLLMGDRQQVVWNADPFDNLWGAGRLRLRSFDSYGLDNPAGWATGDLCVGSALTVTLPAAASPGANQSLGAAVDYLRVVAWWYDRRVDDGIYSHDHDNVDLRLVRTSGTPQTFNSVLDDNRQRVTLTSLVGGSTFEVKLIGRDVTADDEGCGENSMRVYWAWMYEDSARDDADTDLDGETVMTYTRVEP